MRDYLRSEAMGAVPAAVQQAQMDAFLKVMDAIVKVCAVCGEQHIGDSSFHTQPVLELAALRLKADDVAAFLRLPSDLRLLRCVYVLGADGNTPDYYHLHPKHVRATNGGVVVADVCASCYNSLHRQQPHIPTYSIAAGYDFGRLNDDVLPELSVLEQAVIALNIRYKRVFKLSGGQVALQGHVIALPHDSAHVVAQQLPRTDVSQQFRVAFVGDASRWRDLTSDPNARQELFRRFQSVFFVRPDHIYKWLRVLQVINPLYHDLTFRHDADTCAALERIPNALLDDALECTSDLARQVEAQTTARLDSEPAPVGAVFVAPPVRPDRSDAQILAAVRSAITVGA